MEAREHPRITPDLDVFDSEGQKVGTVSHVYERGAGAVTGASAMATPNGTEAVPGQLVAGDGVFEVKTGLFGLGKRYYVPMSAVQEIFGHSCVFLSQSRDEFQRLGWDRRPDYLEPLN